MTRWATLCALLVVLAGLAPLRSVAAQDQQSFVPGFDDLPLMDGLTAAADALTVFDTAAGRIIESRAVGKLAAGDVAAFYRRTLPALGWVVAAAPLTFARDGETLAIAVEPVIGAPADGAAVIVTFSLAPS